MILLSRPLGMLLRRVRPDMPGVVARDYAGTVVVVAVTAVLTIAGIAHRPEIQARQRDTADAIARAQAWIGDRAPDTFRRNLQFVSLLAIVPGTIYRACVPSVDGNAQLLRDRQPRSPLPEQRHVLRVRAELRPGCRGWIATAIKRAVLIASILGSGIVFLDQTIVNVALPSIRASLNGSLAEQQWVVEAYLLTLSSLLLLGGSLGDVLGRRRVFQAGLIGFGVCSVVCALAPTQRGADRGARRSGGGRRPARSELARADPGHVRDR